MNELGPYSRIYWRFRDEFPDVYQDKEAFGWWLTLLVIAEGAYPSAADLPRKLRPRVLEKLIDEELVTLLPGDRYRVRGLDAERQRRSEAGRKGGLASARSRAPETTVQRPSNDRPTNTEATVNLDEQSKDKTSKDEHAARATGLEPIGTILPEIGIGVDAVPLDVRRLQKLAEDLTGQPYVMQNIHAAWGAKAVNEQLPHGFDRVERAWRKIAAQVAAAGTSKPTLRQIVLGADDILNPVPSQDGKEQRADETKAAFDRRVERTRRETAPMREHLENRA
jgi:hypothetical protein